jgi:hypothetical protein
MTMIEVRRQGEYSASSLDPELIQLLACFFSKEVVGMEAIAHKTL